MKTDDFVSYDLAQRLKEVEFKEHCKNAYLKIGRKVKLLYWGTAAKLANDMGGEYVSAPTLWHAQKWLREKWGIHVDACVFSDSSTDADGRKCDEWRYWASNIMLVETAQTIVEVDEVCDSYEQALSAGISAALELIKKGE